MSLASGSLSASRGRASATHRLRGAESSTRHRPRPAPRPAPRQKGTERDPSSEHRRADPQDPAGSDLGAAAPPRHDADHGPRGPGGVGAGSARCRRRAVGLGVAHHLARGRRRRASPLAVLFSARAARRCSPELPFGVPRPWSPLRPHGPSPSRVRAAQDPSRGFLPESGPGARVPGTFQCGPCPPRAAGPLRRARPPSSPIGLRGQPTLSRHVPAGPWWAGDRRCPVRGGAAALAPRGAGAGDSGRQT